MEVDEAELKGTGHGALDELRGVVEPDSMQPADGSVAASGVLAQRVAQRRESGAGRLQRELLCRWRTLFGAALPVSPVLGEREAQSCSVLAASVLRDEVTSLVDADPLEGLVDLELVVDAVLADRVAVGV